MRFVKAGYAILDELNGTEILRKLEKIGRVCYKSENKITEDSHRDFIAGIVRRGHEAMIEHFSFSVKFITDRGISHEIVRHRLASFAQESTRYCNYSSDKFSKDIVLILPENLTAQQKERREKLFWHMQEVYMAEIEEGLTPQIARDVLPTCLKTEIVVTANLREWRTIFKLRTPKTAHPRINKLMIPLLEELKTKIPIIFDDVTVNN